MPGSQTAPGRTGTRSNAPVRLAFRNEYSVGARFYLTFAAQWLAYAIPYRRFADILTEACARLRADVVCYAFIVADLHRLLLAGLPAHSGFDPLQKGLSASAPRPAAHLCLHLVRCWTGRKVGEIGAEIGPNAKSGSLLQSAGGRFGAEGYPHPTSQAFRLSAAFCESPSAEHSRHRRTLCH